MKKAINRDKLYWVCQSVGWLLYAIANVLLIAGFNGFSIRQLAIQFSICATGLLLTHAFRLLIKRRDWTNLRLKFLVWRIGAACVLLALVWELIVLVLLIFVFQAFTLAQTEIAIVFATTFNWSATLLIWSLIYFGFHFIENYRTAEIEKWRLEALVKEAELRALKSQMNPHFIFNCLNSIRALIIEDPERAQTVVTQLANILRYSLKSNNRATVPLAEELQTVSNYLALETVRLEERLKIIFCVDPATLDVRVPTMLVQTLVENAVKFGIAPHPDGGEIRLTSQLQNSKLQIQIRNTGRLTDSPDSTSVGLKNATERLKLLFGDAATLTLKSSKPDYVTANLEIPLAAD